MSLVSKYQPRHEKNCLKHWSEATFEFVNEGLDRHIALEGTDPVSDIGPVLPPPRTPPQHTWLQEAITVPMILRRLLIAKPDKQGLLRNRRSDQLFFDAVIYTEEKT